MDEEQEREFDLDDVVHQWRVDYLPFVPAPKSGIPYPQLPWGSARLEFLKILVTIIKDAGKERGYFTNSRKKQIAKHVLPKGRKYTATELTNWENGTVSTLSDAVSLIYTSKDKPKIDVQKTPTTEPVKLVEPKKLPIKRHNRRDYENIDEPEVERTLDPEMAELLGLNIKK